MSGRAAPRDRRRVPRRTLFRRSDDGRPSLYGDGLVRLWLDGPAAGGASARAGDPDARSDARGARAAPDQRAEPLGATQGGQEDDQAVGQEEREEGRQEGRQEVGQEGGQEDRQEDRPQSYPPAGQEEGRQAHGQEERPAERQEERQAGRPEVAPAALSPNLSHSIPGGSLVRVARCSFHLL